VRVSRSEDRSATSSWYSFRGSESHGMENYYEFVGAENGMQAAKLTYRFD
jgi:hypothetical protein